MLRDYIGLREEEEKGRVEERGRRGCWEALLCPRLSGSSGGFQAEIPFPGSSQGRAGLRWAVWAVPTCSLTAASFHAGSLGMLEAPWPGMEAAGASREALCVLRELLSCLKSSAFQRKADPYIEM